MMEETDSDERDSEIAAAYRRLTEAEIIAPSPFESERRRLSIGRQMLFAVNKAIRSNRPPR